MTSVLIEEGKKNITQHWMIKAEGHANFAPAGQDIVCAAVSSLIGSLRLTLQEWEARGDIIDLECVIYEGNLTIVFWSKSDTIQILIENLEIGIRAIANEYPDHVSIRHRKKEF